jgi:polyisoprenoid-binding protein YceI
MLSRADQRLHVGFSASGRLRRSAYGIDLDLPLGMDRFALDDTVYIEVDAQFIAR